MPFPHKMVKLTCWRFLVICLKIEKKDKQAYILEQTRSGQSVAL